MNSVSQKLWWGSRFATHPLEGHNVSGLAVLCLVHNAVGPLAQFLDFLCLELYVRPRQRFNRSNVHRRQTDVLGNGPFLVKPVPRND